MSALDRMRDLVCEWDEVGDGRAVFLDCYAHMTEAVETALERNRFADGDWVGRLLERFADYYFDSIDGGERAAPVPQPWVLAHAAAVGNDATVPQLLLAGVNAHINYDLVLTLVDLLGPDWARTSRDERAVRRADYDLVNCIISETADRVQDDVLERRVPLLDTVDHLLGRWDERVTTRLLAGWRSRVWRQSVDLLDRPPDLRGGRLAAIEHQCARRARWILI